jgi:hypothetical protein
MLSPTECSSMPRVLLLFTTLYFFASLGHFVHNAEFICTYPNLPAWLTRTQVYATWAGITAVGAFGLFLISRKWVPQGVLLIAVYAAFGFDGLGHYALAPMTWHTFTANLTIFSEVFAAAMLLAVAGWTLASRVRHRSPGSQKMNRKC